MLRFCLANWSLYVWVPRWPKQLADFMKYMNCLKKISQMDYIVVSTERKMHNVRVKRVFMALTGDYSPGDSHSSSSEKLL